MTPVQLNQLYTDIAERIVQARAGRAEPLEQCVFVVPEATIAAIHEYSQRLSSQPTSYGKIIAMRYLDCVEVRAKEFE